MSSQSDTAQPRPEGVTWPLLSGMIPPLAEAYVPRQETGLSLAASMVAGQTGLLIPSDDDAGKSLGSLGGTGKTQLATAIAHVLWEQQALDLLVWVTPSGQDAVLTSYAQALYDVGEPVPSAGPELAASLFLDWLAETDRPWLVVFDDLDDPAVLDGLWPRGARGRVLVTSRRPDTALRGLNPRVLPVGTLSPREALSYLSARLHADPDQWIGALDLASDLGYLPIALAQAGALMAETGLDCREYRDRVAGRTSRLAGGQADAYPSVVAATWSLGVELAEQLPPGDLARPMLALTSMLDANGIPGAVLTSQAACAYLTRCRGAPPVDEAQARAAVYNLARAGLATVDATSAARTIRVHALVQATVRQNLSAEESADAARAAAEALLQTWPRPGVPASFEQAMRDSTARLYEAAGRLLWTPECHPLLLRAGRSLETGRLRRPATSYWQSLLNISTQLLGPDHAQTIQARDLLAASHEAAGHPDDAVTVYERVLTERERILGPGHPDTMTTRASLARAYQHAGRSHDAIRLAERALAEDEHVLGSRHPDTLTARSEAAEAYLSAGMLDQAIAAFRHVLASREQVLGPVHPDTLTARSNLAHAYREAGQASDALALYERTLADRARIQGPDHPDTLTARSNLAAAFRAAGRYKDALTGYKRTLEERERVQGPDHLDTLTARSNLADAYFLASKFREAIPLYEETLADRERVQGPDHPDTITARGDLASAYHSGRKLTQAIPLYEQTLADSERVLGPAHPSTLACRGNLAHAYHTVGRQTEALSIFERTLADCERALGPDHPLTRTARENLEAAARA
jgi:tetratricopeptide (TPR) repeat protein